jgi:hypothetical protein
VADTIAALKKEQGMDEVDELIVTGSSAGGLATILNQGLLFFLWEVFFASKKVKGAKT